MTMAQMEKELKKLMTENEKLKNGKAPQIEGKGSQSMAGEVITMANGIEIHIPKNLKKQITKKGKEVGVWAEDEIGTNAHGKKVWIGRILMMWSKK